MASIRQIYSILLCLTRYVSCKCAALRVVASHRATFLVRALCIEILFLDVVVMNHDERIRRCFVAILSFVDMGSDIQAIQDVYAVLCAHLDALFHDAPRGSQLARDGVEIAYAIVALADEMAMKSAPSVCDYWAPRTLQVRYFEEHAAGDNFFVRLQDVRTRASAPAVLSAYYMALMLGFEGRYANTVEKAPIYELMAELCHCLAKLKPSSAGELTVKSAALGASQSGPVQTFESNHAKLSWWTPRRAWSVLACGCLAWFVLLVASTWYLRSAAKPLFAMAAQCMGP